MSGGTLYFDWAATALPDETIIREAADTAISYYANPSSQHKAGRLAREKLEEARSCCAKVLQVPSNTLFFTSGGTESDQIVLLSFLQRPKTGNILISNIEHPAVREQAHMLAYCGWKIREIPVDDSGILTPQSVVSAIDSDTAAIFIMAVNNETGAIQPLHEIIQAVRTNAQSGRHIWIHADCVQAAGKIPISLTEWDIDSAAFSAHKLGGPRGIGMLYMRRRLEPFLKGGGQELGMRSGTENIFGAWGLSRCLQKYLFTTETNSTAMQRYYEQHKYCAEFIETLRNIPGCTIIPAQRGSTDIPEDRFSPWIVQASFKGVPGEVMVRALSEQGIYISTGSACSSKKKQRPVLDAMRVPQDIAQNAVRFSFGPATTHSDMQTLAQAVRAVASLFYSGKR